MLRYIYHLLIPDSAHLQESYIKCPKMSFFPAFIVSAILVSSSLTYHNKIRWLILASHKSLCILVYTLSQCCALTEFRLSLLHLLSAALNLLQRPCRTLSTPVIDVKTSAHFQCLWTMLPTHHGLIEWIHARRML